MVGNLLASLFTVLGGASPSGSNTCPRWILDEPEMPKSMIER